MNLRRRLLLATGAAVLGLAGLVSPAAAADAPTWSLDLGATTPDSSNVLAVDRTLRLGPGPARAASAGSPSRTGIAVYQEHQLDQPANTVSATVTATIPDGSEVAIDVRGLRPDGEWSEWTEVRPDTPAVLPAPTSLVQARVVLNALDGTLGPEVNAVTLTASSTAAAPSPGIAAPGNSYRVFATREGLVGGTTANGHVIVARDHFVALPSRRGLSPQASGTYSVRVCASNGRCEWAPVWDVGPWNTKDDYWNANREMWTDLPQGKPEAQAAYQDGYNGGKDEFGRTVANPAGIDLADGTFWDGLGLSDNAWVTVTYLWTGSGPAGVVRTAADPLTVRAGASTGSSAVGLAAKYAQVRVECQATGDTVTGTQGTSNIWYRIASGKFVAKAYISGVSGASSC
jgi:hypothetical protein